MFSHDLIVLGAGPAGVSAAVSAAAAGLKVALFDEHPDAFQGELETSAVDTYFEHQVWAVSGDFRVDAIAAQGPMERSARALIIACGSHERVVPFEGWETPGVISLAAAQTLLMEPDGVRGRSMLIAGCGPMLAELAARTVACGGKVAAIADLASAGEWARALSGILVRPNLLRRCFKWWQRLRRARVPRLLRHTILKVELEGDRLRAVLAPCDSAGCPIAGARVTTVVDCIAVGHGSSPSTEVAQLLRAAHRYSRESGGWIATVDDQDRTSRPRLYVAGDSAGILGEAAAASSGRLAGLACALELGAVDQAGIRQQYKAARRKFRRAARAGRAMAHMMALRPGHTDGIEPHTMVCRCEGVTREQIDAAWEAGTRDVNQLKAWTRCGMGLCQGRQCADIAAELLARRASGGSRASVGFFTARTPLRPVTVEALTGDFTYADIRIPVAAPP